MRCLSVQEFVFFVYSYWQPKVNDYIEEKYFVIDKYSINKSVLCKLSLQIPFIKETDIWHQYAKCFYANCLMVQ